MRRGWLALPVLVALAAGPACSPLPKVQAAARSLRFTVDRVEPRLQLAFPLDRTRLAIQITFTVDNPSDVAFHIKGFEGDLHLEAPSETFALGHVVLVNPLDLAPQGRATLTMAVSFAYQDLQAHWPAIQAALVPGAAGAWSLEGRLQIQAYGLSWALPVKTRQVLGGQP